jgi:ribonuclease E
MIHMTRKMLVDATHAEETRVAVVDGHRLIEFDYESTVRKQLKGSIFLAKVTRVEPSLQAAFVNFGGNRHGFLPFAEIHTDYYRIPVADRDALLAEQKAALEAEAAAEEEAERRAEEAARARQDASRAQVDAASESDLSDGPLSDAEGVADSEDPYVPETVGGGVRVSARPEDDLGQEVDADADRDARAPSFEGGQPEDGYEQAPAQDGPGIGRYYANDDESAPNFSSGFDSGTQVAPHAGENDPDESDGEEGESSFESSTFDSPAFESAGEGESIANAPDSQEEGNVRGGRRDRFRSRSRRGGGGRMAHRSARSEIVGGEDPESESRPRRFGMRRQYKIQEVIKRGQIMLIQVSKEERGNKGAAVTTYLSLPGRYCVLMPNSPRGGGVSRKIANPDDRQKMKEILSDLNIPEGMSVILRTAGVARGKAEIRRDLDYLLNLWDEIRDLTLKSSAPSLIYEEASLIKRAVRDLYAPEIDEIVVSGESAFRAAQDFMKILMPSHEKKVVEYRDERVSLFGRHQIEQQIQAIGEPVVPLRSGGYLVINPTEALVSVDVNSGRATKERHIEETAVKTNLEAADEVARQLRLRDLGGLVVIDFIDMEDRRNNARVERRLKEALSSDRARIQVGRISSFGLMELSRQRLNPSLTETQFEKCPHCKGVGHIRTLDSAAINALRALEEAGVAGRADEVSLAVSSGVALYILNNKRFMLADIERRYGFKVLISVEESLAPAGFRVDAVRASSRESAEVEGSDEAPAVRPVAEEGESAADSGRARPPRRGRGGEDRSEGRAGGRFDRPRRAPRPEGENFAQASDSAFVEVGEGAEPVVPMTPEAEGAAGDADRNSEDRGGARRRGRRGGRRRGGRGPAGDRTGASQSDTAPAWADEEIRQPDPAWQPGETEDPDDNIGNRREDPPQENRLERAAPRREDGRGRRWGGRSDSRTEHAGPRREPRARRDGPPASGSRAEPAPAARPADSAGDDPVPAPAAQPRGVTVRQPARRTESSAPDASTPRLASPHETVNPPAGEKKRGWWNRFMEG